MRDFKGFGDIVADLATDTNPAGTHIGPSITIQGEISGDEFLIVEGTVLGKVCLKNGILVKQNGLIQADIDALSITVGGSVVGNITAREKIELLAEGKVEGDIRAPKIIIQEGAHIRGHIEMVFTIDHAESANQGEEIVGEQPPSGEDISVTEPGVVEEAVPLISPETPETGSVSDLPRMGTPSSAPMGSESLDSTPPSAPELHPTTQHPAQQLSSVTPMPGANSAMNQFNKVDDTNRLRSSFIINSNPKTS